MNRGYFLLSVLYYLSVSMAQNTSGNFVLKRHYTNTVGTNAIETIQYYDGLGRPNELVMKGISSNGKDLVSLTEFAELDLERKMWLPVEFGTNGEYKDILELKEAVRDFYDDLYPFTENEYELSSLRRPISKKGPGSDWRNNNRAQTIEYFINTTMGELSCLKYCVKGDNDLCCEGTYPKSQLQVTRTTDEDNNVELEFRDIFDHIILNRQILDSDYIDTYYVYDGYGNLRYVLPPLCANLMPNTTYSIEHDYLLQNYAYYYEYSGQGWCTKKKLPGMKPVLMLYDRIGNLVYMQDGMQRNSDKWTFQLYDSRQRPTVSGIITHIGKPSVPSVASSRYIGVGKFSGYETPLLEVNNGNASLLTVKYYDNYDYQTNLSSTEKDKIAYSISSWEGQTAYKPNDSYATNGYLTGIKTFLLDGNGQYTISALYYDIQGKVVQEKSTNYLGGSDELLNSYTFTGKKHKVRHRHSNSCGSVITEDMKYIYDHAERLLKTTYSLNNGEEIVLANNEYDELGRLKNKSVSNGKRISTEYSYNIRSWVTNISNPLFSEKLYYNERHGGNTPQYGGNISAMEWKVNSGNVSDALRGYNYTYDNLSRLLKADYIENGTSSDHYGTSYTYDAMGNILSLHRNGLHNNMFDEIDNLTYTYNGNQLIKVDDSAQDPIYKDCFDFKDGADEDIEYEYDANGNMTKDLNHGICNIEYNCINLPSRVDFLDGSKVLYTYDAKGTKLRTDYYINPMPAVVPQAANEQGASSANLRHTWTDYCGNFIYENDTLKQTLIEGGYISYEYPQNTAVTSISQLAPTYHFYVQDHLGNNRLVVDEKGTIEQINHYYPYGGLMGESKNLSSNQRYKYNGKEFDRMHGLDWYDYGARFHDPATGRWFSVDPLAEKNPNMTSYHFCHNNPINRIDPDGKDDWDKFQGIVRGVLSNLMLGTNLRDSYAPNNFADYNAGLKGADQVSIAIGTALVVDGGRNVATGVGGASVSAAITVGTGGTAAPVTAVSGTGSLVLATVGTAEAGAGAMMLANTSKNSSKGYNRGNKLSLNQANNAIRRGQAPKGIDRVDKAHQPGGQSHVHLKKGRGAVNVDGTGHDGPKPKLTKNEFDFIRKIKGFFEKI